MSFEIENGVLTKYKPKKGETSVTIPDTVTSINNGAFMFCKNLTEVKIPDSVTSIGNGTFWECPSLKKVKLPNSVTSIGMYTFYNCSNLTEITIPDSVTSIGNDAFKCCKNLTSVNMGSSVKNIGMMAFCNCENLKKINFPDSIAHIEPGAFSSTRWFEEYPGDLVIVDNGILIKYKGNDKHVIIPDSATSIGIRAFDECHNLEKVTIPNSVTNIDRGAFSSCHNLKTVIIPDSVTNIAGGAFNQCYNLKKITIPNTVTNIGDAAFSHCNSLKEITIPDSVISIGEKAFYECKSLKEIKVSEKNTMYSDIDGVLFNKDITELLCYPCGKSENSYILPDSVTNIEDFAFKSCKKITEVKIPDSVINIGAWAFKGCSKLTEVKIPDSVTSVGAWAFSDCSNLEKITLKGFTFKIDEQKLVEDISDAYRMLKTKDFSANIYTPFKNAMIIGHFLDTGDEDAEAFIKKDCLRLFKWLIDEKYIPKIYALLNTHKFVTAENIDEIFEHANQKNNVELKLIFMNYKHEHIGMTKKKPLRI